MRKSRVVICVVVLAWCAVLAAGDTQQQGGDARQGRAWKQQEAVQEENESQGRAWQQQEGDEGESSWQERSYAEEGRQGGEIQTTQSTVTTFNTNNLLIILGLKLVAILVFASLGGATIFGKKRSVDNGSGLSSWIGQDDLLFLTTFLVADDLQRHQCISRVACLRPRAAEDLANAATLVSRGSVLLPKTEWRWMNEVKAVRRALNNGLALHGHQDSSLHCRERYPCPAFPAI